MGTTTRPCLPSVETFVARALHQRSGGEEGKDWRGHWCCRPCCFERAEEIGHPHGSVKGIVVAVLGQWRPFMHKHLYVKWLKFRKVILVWSHLGGKRKEKSAKYFHDYASR